jgi:hypothetical protein
MRKRAAVGLIVLMGACMSMACMAKEGTRGDADKAAQVDAYAREHLGVGIHELAWLMDAECEASVYSTRARDYETRKPALDRLVRNGFVKLVEVGSPEFVAICPTPKGSAVRERLLRVSR